VACIYAAITFAYSTVSATSGVPAYDAAIGSEIGTEAILEDFDRAF
jgi:hypothetical protein